MKRGFDLGGRYRNDPIGSDVPRGKSCAQRKSSRDGTSFTGTETRIKDQLMRQFMVNPEGTQNTLAYRESPAWCPSGRHLNPCEKCH